MQLKDFGANFGDLGSLEFNEMAMFSEIVARVIEDLDLVTYTMSKRDGFGRVTGEWLSAVLEKIVGYDEYGTSVTILPPGLVRGYLRSPIPYDDDAVTRLSSFTNNVLQRVLSEAGTQAKKEGSNRLTSRHFLPVCAKLPYPLNRWC